MGEPLPLIFDIHRFALDDGPGIRTTVFLKGCPLACRWCHNPEAMGLERAMAFYPERCILCGACQAACPEAAIGEGPGPRIDRERCNACGKCADVCPATAIRMVGKAYALDEFMEIIRRDRHFFEASGGGVTFSGGEPTLRMEYLGRALMALKAAGLHTAIQTCGMFDYERFARQVLPFVDLIMFDLKFFSATAHKKFTGQDNAVILENFRRLTSEARARVLPRLPLVPGMTATRANLLAIADFLAGLGHPRCDLLPFNPAGEEKRRIVGMSVPPGLPELPLAAGAEDELRQLFQKRLSQGKRSGEDFGSGTSSPHVRHDASTEVSGNHPAHLNVP